MSRTPFHLRSSERRAGRGHETPAGDSGQTLAEYSVLVAAIAVGCVLAVVFVAAVVGGLFGRSDGSPAPGPLVPPRTSQLVYPTTLEECEHGRWRNYAQFASEEECRRYVESLAK